MSQEGPVTMADYDKIVSFMQGQGEPAPEQPAESFDELNRIKQLGGL
jgi:hypothetical protein